MSSATCSFSTSDAAAAPQAARPGSVPLTDGNPLGMDGAQVGVLKQVHHEVLRGLHAAAWQQRSAGQPARAAAVSWAASQVSSQDARRSTAAQVSTARKSPYAPIAIWTSTAQRASAQVSRPRVPAGPSV